MKRSITTYICLFILCGLCIMQNTVAQETGSISRTITILPCSGGEVVRAAATNKASLFTPAVFWGGSSAVETNKRPQSVNKAFADTSHRVSLVKKYSSNNETLKIWLDLVEDQGGVEIGAYNIIGKKIKDFGKYQLDAGITAEQSPPTLELSIADIPNGIYIISVQGDDFRTAFRMTVSR